MEPLSAFSLACNILQIVEYGANVLSRAAEYRTAPNGALSEHDTLNDVMQSLKRLNGELVLLLPSAADSRKVAPHELRLIAANEECMRIADGLITLLERLKVNQPSPLEGIRMGIKSLWYEGKVKAMKNDLSEARDNLNLTLLVFMQHSDTAKHAELLRSSNESERRIIDTIQSTCDSLSSEVRALATQVDSTSLTQIDGLLINMKESHQDVLAALSQKLDTILSRQASLDLVKRQSLSSIENEKAQQRIIDSLDFPQIDERRNKISDAHEGTYEWVLDTEQPSVLSNKLSNERSNRLSEEPPEEPSEELSEEPSEETSKGFLKKQWHSHSDVKAGNILHFMKPKLKPKPQSGDLLSWTRSTEKDQRLYWVYGKPGSGKSTLMRYLFNKLDKDTHFYPWGSEGDVLKVDYFFWAPGTPLQKSFTGLLRSLLFQLFSNAPEIIPEFVKPATWKRAHVASDKDIRWDSAELIRILIAVVEAKMWYTFFLIDGLDEFEGDDKEKDDFMKLIRKLSSLEHVKLCVSSRPLNIFLDAFGKSPKLRLEHHTKEDIYHYIDQELNAQPSFEGLRKYNQPLAQALIYSILDRASGVFLWVRLVVYELVKALRDGDEIPQLLRRVEMIPKDLNAYFAHMMDSIEPCYHKEASTILQVALHQEHEFIALHPLRLIDLICIQDNDDSSALKGGTSTTSALELNYMHNIRFRLDPAIRRVNSRCLCLVECQYLEGSTASDFDVPFVEGSEENMTAIMQIYDWQKLHEYSGGMLDGRVLLCDARLLQLEALVRSTSNHHLVIGLASYVICAIAVPELRRTEYCVVAANRLKRVLDQVVQNASDDDLEAGPWYIGMSLRSYHRDCSSFLTVAIDFGLSAYVRANLTKKAIQDKKGRPILDHILICLFSPRFPHSIGNQLPNLELLRQALELGADPNQITGFGSPWTSFLVVLDDNINVPGRMAQEVLLRAVLLLLQYGANPVLPLAIMRYKPAFLKWQNLRSEGHAGRSANDLNKIPGDLVFVGDYLATLRPQYVLAAELLEDCILLASQKAAEKTAGSSVRK